MKRMELLIKEARKLSQNEIYDADSGVSQDVFVRYFKNAQDMIVKEGVNSKSKLFLDEKIIPTVSGQEFYSNPDGIYLNNIDTIEYALNGVDYVPLEKCTTKERASNILGFAYGYIPRENGFLLTPPVQGGGYLRISFIKNRNSPQKRCGKISSLTLNSGILSALTLDIADVSFDSSVLNDMYWLCVVNRDGVQIAKNIEYDSVDPLTGVVTLTSPHTLADGESIAVGNYVCIGRNTTNLIELPDICESFLIDQAVYQAKNGDSSSWTAEQRNIAAMNAASLIASFGTPSDDISSVPITNYDYLPL